MAEKEVLSFIDQHKLGLKLGPILVGELYLARKLKNPVYIFKQGAFLPALNAGSVPSKEQVATLIKNQHREVYVHQEDFLEIKENLKSALIKVTRSLSVGDPLENGSKDIKLLSMNLGGLYQNPHDDELLMLQFQGSQNLGKFLLENKKLHSQFFQNLSQESFHFTLAQPMLSSMLMLSFLQSTHLFHDREIENLFLASYLKDIGFSMIPNAKYDLKGLTTKDRQLFSEHADFSYELLEGRIPLSKNYLTIIRHHHFLNDKLKELIHKEKAAPGEVILGLESTLVAVFDVIVAMTNERPYRKKYTLYQALELIKHMMSDEYPQEFKALVVFLKQFFKN